MNQILPTPILPTVFNGITLYTRDGLFFLTYMDAKLGMRIYYSLSAAYAAALAEAS